MWACHPHCSHIQLFTFEIAHHVPDGLSHWPGAADDSDYSDNDIGVKDGIKLINTLLLEVNAISYEEREIKNNLWMCEILSQLKLEHVLGEVKALECHWSSPASLLHDFWWMYTGIGEEVDIEEISEKLTHQHCIQDKDGEEYWDDILAYLHLGWLPGSQSEAQKIQRHAKHYFILNDVLWCKNEDRPLLLVVLNQDVRMQIPKNAHNDTRGSATATGGLINMCLLCFIDVHFMNVRWGQLTETQFCCN